MSLTEFEQLLQRYYEGTCSEKEREWVENWMQTSSLNKESKWQGLSTEERKSYVDNLYNKIEQSIHRPQPVTIRKMKRLWWGVAAASCVLLSIGYFATQHMRADLVHTKENRWLTLETDAGSRKKVTLTDGTVVWLQGGSKLSYPSRFDGGERRVRLFGEGYFEVASDVSKPFVVQSGLLEAEVLGTSFNVSAFEELDRKTISLVEGKLAVRARDSVGKVQSEVMLTAGQAAVFVHKDHSLVKSDLPVFDSADDFKVGSLQFEETALDKVLFQVANAYGLQINFDVEKARRHKITAVFSVKDPVDEVLRSLARSTRTHFVRLDQNRVEFKF